MNLLWFKRDLRINDHPAMYAAVKHSLKCGTSLCCVYVYEDSVIEGADVSRRHLLFINDCLRELSLMLEERGQHLFLLRGEVVDIFNRWHERSPIHHIWSHEETGNAKTYARDLAVGAWCRQHKILWTELPQNGVVRRLGCRDGWANQWAARMKPEVVAVPERLPPKPSGIEEDVGLISPYCFGKTTDGETDLQQGGSRYAYSLLESFLSERGQSYTSSMSSPVTAFDACSRISPYLTYGAISVREAYHSALERKEQLKRMKAEKHITAADSKLWNSALRSFLGRLRWHCHFIQKLEDEPELEWRNLYRACDGLREKEWNEVYFQAWCDGRTGYPMVDACMRALRATGWINFRMRAMLMSFASYHLWLHWRRTGLYLARLFTDYEPGIHWSQVQMQSGTTGINSIRVYSPTKQAQDQDPEGTFILQWIPELRNVPAKMLAEPWQMTEMEQVMYGCRIGPGGDYPVPVVNHAEAYQSAQRRIRSVRTGGKHRLERENILRKHGSRKRPASR